MRGLAIGALAGVVLALIGAFGSGAAPMALRLAYWIPVMVVGSAWGLTCMALVDRRLDTEARPWLAIAVLTAMITGPVVLMVWAVTGPVFEGRPYPLSDLPRLIWPVAVVTATLSALNVFLRRATPVQTHVGPPGQPGAPFLDRLPLRLRGATLRAVQAEDHYLRVHTDRGDDLILMRFSDALEELEGLEGAQTHRGWWAAREAVRGVARGDGRATLTLEGGLSVPVSRRYARALREAGWY